MSDTICRREVYLSAIANGEGSGNLPEPICREEVFLKQIAENGTGGGSGTTNYTALTNKPSINGITLTGNKTSAELGLGGNTSIPITTASGASVTIEPNKHYVIGGITNSLTITLSGSSTTEIKKYSFEFSTIDRIPTLKVNGVDMPLNYELAKHTKYLCEIINNKLVFLGAYDGYAYKFVYGLYSSADYTSSYNLKADRTFVATISGTTKNGTYAVEETSGLYLITFTYEDSTVELFTYNTSGTITKDGVVYTKI